ncbi:hypothetical protein Pmani_031582 [Petrolisthes manimaculis]|uniref:C2H2-type domain-containing protein n=1 Tax=Petrolisthes manimaculis TaxID=1843537 RepID=A0AAE1TUQ1_9EUCA|nr:hypothetical protein Pmani_031582 [Petrolisthes manimaculis]
MAEEEHIFALTLSDLSNVPVLEVAISHASTSHALNDVEDNPIMVYMYKPPASSSQEAVIISVDDDDSLKPTPGEDEMIVMEDGCSVVNLHKSVVDEYRRKMQYYGPLKAVVEKVRVGLEGQEKEVLRAKLMQVKVMTKDASGQDMKWEDLAQVLQKIPGIIPPCEPPVSTSKEEAHIGNSFDSSKNQVVQINFSDGESISISKKAIDQYRKLSQVTKPLSAQREKTFREEGEHKIPVTIVRLFPKDSSVPPAPDNQEKVKVAPRPRRGRPRGRGRGGVRGRKKQQPKILQGYTGLPETLKMKDELEECGEAEEVQLSEPEDKGINMFGFEGGMIVKTSPVYNSSLPDLRDLENESENSEFRDMPIQIQSAPVDINVNLTSERIWKYLTDYVSEDARVQGLITQFNNESWLEVKRMSDFFHIDEEVITDVSFKAVYRSDNSPIKYFLRGFSRLLHTGQLTTAGEVNHLLRCLSSNRKLCLGLKPSVYLPHVETNETVRTFFKQTGHYISTPFESLFSHACRGIVTITGSPSAATFVRGNKSILGVYALCKACVTLGKRLDHLIKTTTHNTSSAKNNKLDIKMLEDKYNKQLLKLQIRSKESSLSSTDIRKLFTQSISEVLECRPSPSFTQRFGEIKTENDTKYKSGRRKVRKREIEEEEQDEQQPSVGVTEEEFLQMIDLRPPNPGVATRSRVKRCNVCQFRAQTMLSLFTHMKGHMGTLKERCGDCKVQLSTNEALETDKKQIHSERSPMCAICHLDFTTKDQLFDHMNKHREHLPFECPYCNYKLTNMDAYKKHVRLTHKVKAVRELNFACKTCQIHFYTPDHLLLHRVNQNHQEVDPFVCKSCGASKATANDFRSHILEHTEDEREAINHVICAQCFKVFFSTFKLNYHLETKHVQGNMEPVTAAAAAAASHALPDSSTSHELSQKKKKNKGPYLRYLRANEKYECLRCRRRFKTCETLANHVKFSHGGKKKVARNDCSCNMCGRKFNALRRLANHMKIHSGNRPVFQCEECGQIYGKKVQVLEHIRNDHAEQVQRHQQQQNELLQATSSTTTATTTDPLQATHATITTTTTTTNPLTDSGTNHQSIIEVATASTTWSPIKSPFKVPTVEQTQEAVYSLLQLTDF